MKPIRHIEAIKGREVGEKVTCTDKEHFHYGRPGVILSVDREHKTIFNYKVEFLVIEKNDCINMRAWMYPDQIECWKEWDRNQKLEVLGI